jgi:hypothetical protein
MTARTLIRRSLQLLGVVSPGDTPTADESNDGLLTLNSLLESLQTQGRSIYSITRVTKAIVASQASYTIGVGGDINRARPTGITRASLVDTTSAPDLEMPLHVYSQDEWADVSMKDLTSTMVTGIYYNPTFPLGIIYPWPVGTVATYSLVLYLDEPIATIATLDTVLAFPPGYERMLRYKLAVDLSAEYHRTPSPEVMQIATESLAAIKRVNFRPSVLRCDPGVLTGSPYGSNIYTGE